MSFENYSTTGAICPYCGHEHEANGDNYELFSERTATWTCHACGDDFSVAVYIQHSWTTEALEAKP